MDPDKLRSLSQWLDQRTGRSAPGSFPPSANASLPSASVLRSLVESLAARSEQSVNQNYAVQQGRSNDHYQMPELCYDPTSAYNPLDTRSSPQQTPNLRLLRDVDPWMIDVYEGPSHSAPQFLRHNGNVRSPALPSNINDAYYALAYQNALRERGYLPPSGSRPLSPPTRLDYRSIRSHSRSPRRETSRRSPSPDFRRRSPRRRERSPTPPRRRERRSPISPPRRRRSRSPRIDRRRPRQRSRSPRDRRRSRSPVDGSRRRSLQNSSKEKNRRASPNIMKKDIESVGEPSSKPENGLNNMPLSSTLRVPIALNEAIPYPNILQYIKTAISDFRRTWRNHYRDETDWNGYAYNIRFEIRAQLAKMCNFDGGENGKTFALLSAYVDNKMAMKMHTGCQMVKDLKKKRKKRKHRALVGENSVKAYRVEDSYDCHHGFKANYEHCHHDLANLRAINAILGIEEPTPEL